MLLHPTNVNSRAYRAAWVILGILGMLVGGIAVLAFTGQGLARPVAVFAVMATFGLFATLFIFGRPAAIRRRTPRPRGGRFFVDQLSNEELMLFHDPERP